MGQYVLTNVGQSNILCYSIDKMCIKKVKCHACNFVNFGAYNAAILFVLRSRLTILRLEDDNILDHDKAMTGQDF